MAAPRMEELQLMVLTTAMDRLAILDPIQEMKVRMARIKISQLSKTM